MFINLTPHSIVVAGRTFQPSGTVARVSQVNTVVGTTHDGIELVQASYGAVMDLPEPVAGTLFIVSAMVRAALPERKDLVSPGDAIRDADGKIIGVKNLVIN